MSSWSWLLRVLFISLVWATLGGGVAAESPVDAHGRPLFDDRGPLWYRGDASLPPVRDASGVVRQSPLPGPGGPAVPGAELGRLTGAFSFGAWTSHHPGSWPEAVAIGDVTGDGRPDVVMTTTFSSDPANDYRVFVYPQLPEGTLGLPTGYSYLTGASRNGIVLVDLNEDQVLDVVVGHDVGVSVLLADGAGGLQPATVHNGHSASALATVDVNLDQHADVVALSGQSIVTVFLGDGLGGFTGVQEVTVGDPNAADFELGDLDGDSFDDLAVVSGEAVLTVTYHDQVSGFVPGPSSYPMGGISTCEGIGVGDVTGDGLEDVVLGRPFNSPTHLWLMIQDGSGGLSGPSTISTYDIPEPVAVQDVDGDGLEDVVVLHAGWLRAGLYLQGASGLEPEQLFEIPYASHYSSQGLALGDISSDSCNDLAIADYNQGLVILHGSGCEQLVFADGFESGTTTVWSLTLP